MKKIIQRVAIIVCIMMSYNNNLYAQDIVIRFSFLDESCAPKDTLHPYLQIEYINNSSHSYYLPALVPFDRVLPCYSTSIHFSDSENDERKISLFRFDSCQKVLYDKQVFQGVHYYLPLDFLQMKDAYWTLVKENVFFNGEEIEEDLINYCLYTYEAYLHDNEYNKTVFPLYGKRQIKNPFIVRNSPSFVFLNKNGKVTQRISLSGIMGTGITLTICLASPSPPQKMSIDWGMNGLCNLPPRVFKYHLYKGTIESNSITKQF